MASQTDIVKFANDELKLHKFPDYGPMGLQFSGDKDVKKIASAVSVSIDVINRAAAVGANLLVVHHGMFWNNESRLLDERVAGRLKALESHGMTLLAYHLALDAHPKMGNNILLARNLGLGKLHRWEGIGWSGEFRQPMHSSVFYQQAGKKLKLSSSDGVAYLRPDPFHVHKVAVIAGAAAHYIVQAHRDGFDTFVTGENTENAVYLAEDLGMNFFAFGHDKTERAGVQTLGRQISKRFRVPHEFLSVENPA